MLAYPRSCGIPAERRLEVVQGVAHWAERGLVVPAVDREGAGRTLDRGGRLGQRDNRQRYLCLPVCPNPTQYAAGLPQPHSSLNISFANKRSFISNVMRAKHPTFAALMKAAACRVDKGNFHA